MTIAKYLSPARPDANGYVLLLSVLVVGAVGVSIAVSLLLLGLSNSLSSFALEQSNGAKALSNACAEEALEQIFLNNAFVGTNSLTLGQGSCSYTVTNTGTNSRQIVATGTIGSVVRKLVVNTNALSPKITIGSWQEEP